MAKVCAEIAVRDDPRLLSALGSLDAQRRRPDRVLVAASTESPAPLLEEAAGRFPQLNVTIARYPGGVVDARAMALPLIDEEITVFLDSDEVAPPGWLELLVAPIEQGSAAFAGGPTRPSRPPATSLERYAVLLERSIYEDLVPSRVTYLPLQNTAWSTAAIRRLGFDPRIPFAEDHDLEVRAAKAGLTGVFVPEAWVYHDPATAPGYLRWARKRYRYLVAMTMSLEKNGELASRFEERRRPVRHVLRAVEVAMKPFALLEGTARWRRLVRSPPSPRTPSP